MSLTYALHQRRGMKTHTEKMRCASTKKRTTKIAKCVIHIHYDPQMMVVGFTGKH